MSRLTQRDGDSYIYNEYAATKDGSCCFGVACLRNQAIDKLGRIEDAEDGAGCPAETVFKALANGIWTKGGFYSDVLDDEPHFVKRPEIGIVGQYDEYTKQYDVAASEKDAWCIYTYDYEVRVRVTRLKDYGRTWALTKEELQ